jgi:DNA-binding transcriptional LysR family regulator
MLAVFMPFAAGYFLSYLFRIINVSISPLLASEFGLDAAETGLLASVSLYRERSVSREAALAVLNANALTWEIIYTSPSLTGLRAAALAGLAITPLPASALIAGLRILGVEHGLPRLPDLSSRSTRSRGPTRPRRRWLWFC